ncbi:hypothetical protein SLEP1_g41642 [Rubroshorea leprosula]|nr:hypothetical protein SLEP1_g41642 [Rubroshorea leprosula]
MVTIKDIEVELVRILTVFTIIDLSSRIFHGQIPEELVELSSLLVLNFPCNNLTVTG